MSRSFAALAAALLVLSASPSQSETRIVGANAQQVAGSPTFRMVVGIPKVLTRNGVTTVGDGALGENTIYVFTERQGVVLDAALHPGRGPAIPAGTMVDSAYVCIDTTEAPSNPGPRNGTAYSAVVKFDNPNLLGMALRPQQLGETARVLGKPGVTYANSRFLGVDPYWMGQDDQAFAGGVFVFSGDANGIDCRRLIFRSRG